MEDDDEVERERERAFVDGGDGLQGRGGRRGRRQILRRLRLLHRAQERDQLPHALVEERQDLIDRQIELNLTPSTPLIRLEGGERETHGEIIDGLVLQANADEYGGLQRGQRDRHAAQEVEPRQERHQVHDHVEVDQVPRVCLQSLDVVRREIRVQFLLGERLRVVRLRKRGIKQVEREARAEHSELVSQQRQEPSLEICNRAIRKGGEKPE